MKNKKTSGIACYQCCWLHTAGGDYYAGMLVSNRFEGNRLTIIFSDLVKLEKDDKPLGWHALAKIRPTPYSFEFDGCALVQGEHENQVEVTSSLGDKLTLSSNLLDMEKIKALVAEIE